MIRDPLWENTSMAGKISAKIESIRLIPNRAAKITLFEALFGRPANIELSNMLMLK